MHLGLLLQFNRCICNTAPQDVSDELRDANTHIAKQTARAERAERLLETVEAQMQECERKLKQTDGTVGNLEWHLKDGERKQALSERRAEEAENQASDCQNRVRDLEAKRRDLESMLCAAENTIKQVGALHKVAAGRQAGSVTPACVPLCSVPLQTPCQQTCHT